LIWGLKHPLCLLRDLLGIQIATFWIHGRLEGIELSSGCVQHSGSLFGVTSSCPPLVKGEDGVLCRAWVASISELLNTRIVFSAPIAS